MRLYELFKDEKIKCSNVDLNAEFNSIESYSKLIKSKDVFVAIRGENRNGNDYIKEALDKGAIAIVTDVKGFYKDAPIILVENARKALAKMWNCYYGNPTKDLKLIAITGTNGKTSTAYILYSIIKASGKAAGLISTVECLINGKTYDTAGGGETGDIPAAMTTPDPKVLYRLFYEMKAKGVKYIVMEASSHALSQFKLSGANIYMGAFTNLSSEHLDYHKTIEEYYNSKKRLFKMCKYKITNIDDEYGKRLKKEFPDAYTVSVEAEADFSAQNTVCSDTGCSFTVKTYEKYEEIKSRLMGKYAPSNIMLAIACAKILNLSEINIKDGIWDCNNICGRMEKVRNNIYIDYAHTPKAVEKTIMSVKGIHKDKRITVLFGCGGNRDTSKRAIIGKIVSTYADKAIITSDNPRNEDKMSIINDILSGININSVHYVIPNRKDAISFAVRNLKKDEVLILLGKGHEKYEIDENGKHCFDERKIIGEILDNV